MKSLLQIVGQRHRDTTAYINGFKDGEPVTLKREPMNEFDANAIQVWLAGKHVGYIPKKHNTALANEMDAKPGIDLIGKLWFSANSRYPHVEIDGE